MAKIETVNKRVTTKERKPRAPKTPALKTKKAAPKPAPERKVKILYAVSEAQPFAGTGGLAEVAGSLPKALNATGRFDARVMLPYYKENIAPEFAARFRFVCKLDVRLSWRTLYCGVFEYDHEGVKYYFIDNEYYFKRRGLYGFYDDGERFAFFSQAVCEVLYKIDFIPDILHANDWQTALAPVYYKLFYMHRRDGYRNIKTVFTVHNVEYQGKFDKGAVEDLFGISRQELHSLEFDGCINLLKAAADYCDALTTVSPTYARELTAPEHAHGLSEIFKWNAGKLTGILNGIDYDSYDPARDPALFARYSAGSLAGKAKNKTELQKLLDLKEDARVPVVAVISRLVAHKGIDLIKASIQKLLERDVQVILLGKGDADYETYFQYVERNYEKRFKAMIAFNKDMSRKIYAAADIFLMPSKSEPCGLSQMIASRYATVPVVRETGGLADSIKDCFDGASGNGYTFANYNADDLLNALDRALGLYRDYPEIWDALQKRVAAVDFSWGNSAKEYAEFYANLLK
ncbi:MAG: glycogen synthase [Clostridiales bacterium]|jgi:starch synthase|nr:glycogen synthase [Clostridiales bacterium]